MEANYEDGRISTHKRESGFGSAFNLIVLLNTAYIYTM